MPGPARELNGQVPTPYPKCGGCLGIVVPVQAINGRCLLAWVVVRGKTTISRKRRCLKSRLIDSSLIEAVNLRTRYAGVVPEVRSSQCQTLQCTLTRSLSNRSTNLLCLHARTTTSMGRATGAASFVANSTAFMI